MCTKGSSFQNLIANTNDMLPALYRIINSQLPELSKTFELKCFQLLANLCVNNKWCQEKIWTLMSDAIIRHFESEECSHVNVGAMIVYNLVLNKSCHLNLKEIVKILLHHYNNFLKNTDEPLPDFAHILMDYMICKKSDILEIYQQFEVQDAKTFLYYVHDHVENDTSE